MQLQSILADATRREYIGLAFDARLAIGEIEMRGGQRDAARARLTSLKQEAAAKGFVLIARKARAALENVSLAAATAWIELLFEQGAITVDDYLGQARADLPREAPTAALNAAFHDALRRALTPSEQRLRERPSDADAHWKYAHGASLVALKDTLAAGPPGAPDAAAGPTATVPSAAATPARGRTR